MQPKGSLQPHYETIDPDSINSTDDPDDELAEKPLREPEKVAISQSRIRAVLRTLLYLLPVGLSFGILQLSFRHVYWRVPGSSGSDASRYTIAEILNVLQIVAKVHEILVVTSLSHLVLYYIRQQLCSPSGLSFGLLSSAYQTTSCGHPLSHGFWQTCKSFIRKRTFQWRAFGLVLLLVLAALLGIATGPASAIAVLPRLDWWYYQDLFSLYEQPSDTMAKNTNDFDLYIPKQLFPSEVNSSSLPGSYCLESALDINATCPFAGFGELLRVFSPLRLGTDNFTLTEPTPLSRRMATERTMSYSLEGEGIGRAACQTRTWTQSQVLTNYLSLGWQSDISNAPYIIETTVQNQGTPSPVVDVTCEMAPSTNHTRDLSFFSDPYGYGYTNSSQSGRFDITNIWSETVLAESTKSKVEWKEFFEDTDHPVLAAFILSPSGGNGTSNNVTMCGVEARWHTVDMRIMSSGAESVISNFRWETADDTTSSAGHPAVVFPVSHIRKDWADSLNAASANSSTVLTDLIDGALQTFHRQGPRTRTPVDVQSKILSMAVADGLARIGAEYNVNNGVSTVLQGGTGPQGYDTMGNTITLCRRGWCSQGYFVDNLLGPAILNGTVNDFLAYYQELDYTSWHNVTGNILHSFPQPADIATSWTQVSFPVQRYGYGWGFNTVGVKIATAILILHAVVIVLHCCLLMYSGVTYSFIGSLGDLIALALISEPPSTLISTSVGIAQNSTWSQPTTVREVGEKEYGASRLALIVGGGHEAADEKAIAHRRPVVGRGYE